MFENLAQMPAEQNREIEPKDYRVSFFGTGSSKTSEDQVAMELAWKISTEITEQGGHKVVTGGYDNGIMEAASMAAYDAAGRSGDKELVPEGITLGPALGKPTQYAEITEAKTLLDRLQTLINGSDAMIVFHGKTGTFVELITTIWENAVANLTNEEAASKPVIIVNSSQEHPDVLATLNRKDPKFRRALNDVYIISASDSEAIQEAIDKVAQIVEYYYQKARGLDQPEAKEEIDRYGLNNFLRDMESFSDGGGI